jgi:germination protein M
MRKTKFILLFLMISCLLVSVTGCSEAQRLWNKIGNNESAEITITEATPGIYQMNTSETRLQKVSYEVNASSIEALIEGCIQGLETAPSDNSYKNVVSGDVQIQSYTYDSSSRLVTLYFHKSYNNLSASAEVLTRAAIVKTLTQFSDEIQYVSFVIGDTPMTTEDGSVKLMRGRDFVDNISGNMEYVREDYVTMYFVSSDGAQLQAEDVVIKYLSKINLETALVNSLISGPITEGLKPSLSPDTVVNKVSIREGICYVDLDTGFLKKVDDQSFELNIYSVVNTLTQVTGVSRVQFLIDGDIYSGTIDGVRIDGLFEKNTNIVYRSEKEGQTTNAAGDILQGDIEQQVKDNQKNSESTGE